MSRYLLRLARLTTIKEIAPRAHSLPNSSLLRSHQPCLCPHLRASSTCTMGVKILVTYCGGWGYKPKFTKLKTQLEDEFPGDLDITGESTPSTTGWFEVEVGGTVVHSKKNGEGFVDDDKKMAKIVSAIEKCLG